MLAGSRRVRRQLEETPGCLRFANIVMAPREIWTITVWRTRQEMLDFMRSGAHEDIMWSFSTWLESFWLMRWRPSSDETGAWAGLHLGQEKLAPTAPSPQTPQQKAALDAALESLPRLRAASSPDGAASLDYAPSQRRNRALVEGAVGGTIRVEVPSLMHAPPAWRSMSQLRRSLLAEDKALRCAIGVAESNALYLLALFPSQEIWGDFLDSDAVSLVRERWGDGVWTMRWDADNEFGHWDGLRLRRVKLARPVDVPHAAEAAADVPISRPSENDDGKLA